ncbi:MAG: glucosyltransferase domain-containing protein [Chloroflexota bacterium]|nr:glucosyltransferase domain-containing protein [Chloroflexota bacterium]
MPTGSDERDELSLLDEARDFFRDNALVLLAAAGAMLLAYGFALTTFSVSIDEETRFLGDRTGVWFEQGRPVIAMVKFVLGDTLPLPFYSLALSLAFLYVGGVLWVLLFGHVARLESRRRAGMLAFLVVFLTLPVNAYYLTFGTLNIESSLAVIWSAAGAWCTWLWAVERRGWPWLVGAIAFVFLAVGTYQAYAFAALAGVLIAQLIHLLTTTEDDQPRLSVALRQTARLIAPIVVVLGLAVVVNYVLVDRGGYTEETFIAWGDAGVRAILGRLRDEIGSYLTGTGFVGGWVLIPTVIAAIALIAAVVVRAWRRHSWYPVLLLLIILLLPFALSAALGTPLPNRALKALPLVAGGIWLLLALVVPHGRALTAGLLGAAIIFAIWNGSIVTRLFVSEQLTYEADLRTSSQIMERLERAGWDGERVPLVVVGRRMGGPAERIAVDETFGGGFFWRSGGLRAPGFMQAFGFPVMVPNAEERAAGAAAAEDMPDWPAHGSVVLEDGVAIVKFGDPPTRASTR